MNVQVSSLEVCVFSQTQRIASHQLITCPPMKFSSSVRNVFLTSCWSTSVKLRHETLCLCRDCSKAYFEISTGLGSTSICKYQLYNCLSQKPLNSVWLVPKMKTAQVRVRMGWIEVSRCVYLFISSSSQPVCVCVFNQMCHLFQSLEISESA